MVSALIVPRTVILRRSPPSGSDDEGSAVANGRCGHGSRHMARRFRGSPWATRCGTAWADRV